MIRVQNLTKAFGPKKAVNNLSFTVEKGEVLGFLGPNGAGKSTTMRMITGFIPPTSGTVSIGGHDIVDDAIAARRLFGYLPESAPSYTDMTVHGFLHFIAELRGLTGDARKRAVNKVIATCFLEAVVHQSVETLSKGFRHRLCFAQSILHDPEVLVMDEPTDGLDPNQKHEVRGLIKEMGRTKAIIFSTHILEEVEAACSRAIIIDRGSIVANGTPEELKARSVTAGTVLVRLSGDGLGNLTGRLGSLPLAKQVLTLESASTGKASFRVVPTKTASNGDLAASVAALAKAENWKLEELHTDEGRLDEVFRNVTLSDTSK
jgi:ABC-2 type transport system ATP-binding protein